MWTWLWIFLSAYLLGSIPVSYLMVRAVKGLDLRAIGSGNIGASNVYRALGPAPAVLAFLGDALKGTLPVGLALWVATGSAPAAAWGPAGAGLLAVLGHLFPPWLKFRGGKGVATAFGVMLALAPLAALLALALWAALTLLLKVVSVASLAAALALPVLVYFLEESRPAFMLAVSLFVLIWLAHRDNLARLARGEEKPIRRAEKPEKL